MSDRNIYDTAPDVITLLPQSDRLIALVIVGLFALIWAFMIRSGNRHKAIELQIEEAKNDILMEIQETKSCVLRIMYDLHLRQDRRKRNLDVDDDRRIN